jgi:SAM-dependent methyltransferase
MVITISTTTGLISLLWTRIHLPTKIGSTGSTFRCQLNRQGIHRKLISNSQAAPTYSSAEWQKDMINRTHAFILSNINWIGVDFLDPSTAFEKGKSTPRQVRVLDYACGPGTITSILQGYATEFVGVDLSGNMVKEYNRKFAETVQQSGSITQKAEAFVGDLLDSKGPSDSVSETKFSDFDLAVVGYGFHHFQDLNIATSRLVSRLKPGGVLLIVDFFTHAKEDGNPAKNTIAHHGFGEEEVKRIFGNAGLRDVGMLEMEGTIWMKKPGAGVGGPAPSRKVFMGRGRKPV